MLTAVDKLKQVLRTTFENGGAVEIGVNFRTGTTTLNGIPFTMLEQLTLNNEFAKDPDYTKLMSTLQHSDASRPVMSAVSKDEGETKLGSTNFNVNKETLEKFGIKVETGAHEEGDASVTVEDEKDRKIKALQNELAQLKAKQEPDEVTEENLVYPDDFYNAKCDEKVSVHELSNGEVQDLIDDLKDEDLAVGQYCYIKTGDTITIKVRDDEGVEYIVAKDVQMVSI